MTKIKSIPEKKIEKVEVSKLPETYLMLLIKPEGTDENLPSRIIISEDNKRFIENLCDYSLDHSLRRVYRFNQMSFLLAKNDEKVAEKNL